jgi:hypothetical protein
MCRVGPVRPAMHAPGSLWDPKVPENAKPRSTCATGEKRRAVMSALAATSLGTPRAHGVDFSHRLYGNTGRGLWMNVECHRQSETAEQC